MSAMQRSHSTARSGQHAASTGEVWPRGLTVATGLEDPRACGDGQTAPVGSAMANDTPDDSILPIPDLLLFTRPQREFSEWQPPGGLKRPRYRRGDIAQQQRRRGR